MSKTKRREVKPDVRFAVKADLPQIVEIEALSFGSPWTRADFIWTLRYKCNSAIVVEMCDTPVAYAVLHKGRWIINLAVAPHLRRRGIGRLLIERLQKSVGRLGGLQADISESNLDAHLFFRAVGFRAVEMIQVENRTDYRFIWGKDKAK